MKNIILLFLCLLFGGCFSSSDKYVPNEGLNEILIDPEVVEEYLDLSEILQDSIEIIPLETTEQCLISDIKQIELYKDKIFVSDKGKQKYSCLLQQDTFLIALADKAWDLVNTLVWGILLLKVIPY